MKLNEVKKGTVVSMLPTESGVSKASGKEWKKMTFFVKPSDDTTDSLVALVLFNKKLDDYGTLIAVGAEISFTIDVLSREYNGKAYSDIYADNIALASSNAQSAVEELKQNVDAATEAEQNDGLPF